MSGLVKAKKYDWKDSNMALIGTDTDREVKKEAAEKEPAWKNAGKKPGLQVWRINKFKVEAWPTTQYGQFFTGDSYILLNTYKEAESDKLLYDIHFWIGEHSTQDEYGTAAYKTVELDTLLDDIPIQHREVQSHESSMFKNYFKTMTYNKGGADTGFKHVEPESYKPRLYRVQGQGKNVQAKQVKVKKEEITSLDCFVLDAGLVFYIFKGSTANAKESYFAATLVSELKVSRSGSVVHTVDEDLGEPDLSTFYEVLDKADKATKDDDLPDEATQQLQDEQEEQNRRRQSKLIRCSDASGELTYSLVKEGGIIRKDFDSKDVFILDTPTHGLFVWNGKHASKNEKKNGLSYAHMYLRDTTYPYSPVTVLSESRENADFKAALAA
eukprot:TRINITY_DN44986_c0_g3_i2.p1 TRINITY_DN44986_c0_g3~~TRINITY_DN44986_c0_g3_i2.p1  ORF type:complete len:445 (-),score=124.14 TRINITY_DN44986_c0_g3_i2:1884-3032(-)